VFIVELTRGRDKFAVMRRVNVNEPNLYFAVQRATRLLFNAEEQADGYRVLDEGGRLRAELWTGTADP
jgi:hypothetical protein